MHENFDRYLREKWGLTDEQVAKLMPLMKSKQVHKGDFLLKEGEICTLTFYVEKGLLRLYSLNGNGKVNILQFASENWLVSDRGSVYFNEPSHYFIDAVENSTVIPINTNFIDTISLLSPDFRKKNDKLLHNHVRYLHRRVALLLGATAEERYLDFIKRYPDVMLRVPQWMVASYLGITPESLSRVRKQLAQKNFKP